MKRNISPIVPIVFKVLEIIHSAAIPAIICYFLRDIIIALAGKETVANIVVNILADTKYTVSIGTAGITSIGWYRANRRYRKEVERFTKENNELRKITDKKKGSSMLEKNGETNKKDKIL